jgi:hypothetical protein
MVASYESYQYETIRARRPCELGVREERLAWLTGSIFTRRTPPRNQDF